MKENQGLMETGEVWFLSETMLGFVQKYLDDKNMINENLNY
jgi:hypothetical protein